MTTTNHTFAPMQRPALAIVAVIAGVLFVYLFAFDTRKPWLFVIGIGLGVALYHAAFGFTGAYRRAIVQRDISGVTAQLIMLAAAMLLFAPVLATGQVFGQGVVGAMAPVSISMAFGALIFGVGMQMGGGCASGTLFTVGGGNLRMLLVLVFFCIGTFWASLDMQWWGTLPGVGVVSLAQKMGNWQAITLQMAVLALIYGLLRLLGGAQPARTLVGARLQLGPVAARAVATAAGRRRPGGAQLADAAGGRSPVVNHLGIHPVGGKGGAAARLGSRHQSVLDRRISAGSAGALVPRRHHVDNEYRYRHRRAGRRCHGR